MEYGGETLSVTSTQYLFGLEEQQYLGTYMYETFHGITIVLLLDKPATGLYGSTIDSPETYNVAGRNLTGVKGRPATPQFN
jgi:hypothetical protein